MKPLLLIFFIFSLIDQIYSKEIPKCETYKNTEFRWWDTDCGQFCHQIGTTVTCNWWQYHMGCFCKAGYFRTKKWVCVTANECDTAKGTAPPIINHLSCPTNEQFLKCGNQCIKLCESLHNPLACSYKECDTGCFCKDGLYRNGEGRCVIREKCEQQDLPPESSVIKMTYKRNTSFEYHHIISLPSKLKCGKHEEYTSCGDRCSEMCANINTPDICPLTCQTGCFCKQRYYRTNKGVCVPRAKCPKIKAKPNKKPKPVIRPTPTTKPITTKRPKTKKPKTKRPKTTKKPKPGSGSQKELSDGDCATNERAVKCGSRCKELCENADKAKPCPPDEKCEIGCFCKEGFFRNLENFCVKKSECEKEIEATTVPPIQCGPNEKYTTCGSKCSESCGVFTETEAKDCPPNCDEGCFCMQGFYRDSYKQCVPQDQCQCDLPPLICPDNNEEYTSCGHNCRPYCAHRNPKCGESCARGCFCKNDYMRNDSGKCVLAAQCSLAVRNTTTNVFATQVKHLPKNTEDCNDNEVYSECGNLCTDFCESKFDEKTCPMTCEKGCFCVESYKRNSIDKCVEKSKCNQIPECGKNEEYSECGQNCGNRCGDIGRNIHCPLKCDKGCFCLRGYYRDSNGICIQRSECVIDTTPDCNDNEIYSNCSTHCGETCEDLLSPIECPKDVCEKGCFCKIGFYRDMDGNCGTKKDCHLPETTTVTACDEENEEYSECGNRCEESCEDSGQCKKGCEIGCFCTKDHLRNKKGKCVPTDKCKGPEQCAECNKNEYYTNCGSDCGRMCSDIGTIVECNQVCNRGCFCKYGYYRTQIGQCVPKNQCPLLPN